MNETFNKKKKCPICSKKIGILGIECRCGITFCSLHRYPDQHNCSFNFKEYDKKILKENVKGFGEFKKIEKI